MVKQQRYRRRSERTSNEVHTGAPALRPSLTYLLHGYQEIHQPARPPVSFHAFLSSAAAAAAAAAAIAAAATTGSSTAAAAATSTDTAAAASSSGCVCYRLLRRF